MTNGFTNPFTNPRGFFSSQPGGFLLHQKEKDLRDFLAILELISDCRSQVGNR